MSKPNKTRPRPAVAEQMPKAQAPETPAPQYVERRKHPLLLAASGIVLVVWLAFLAYLAFAR